MIRSLYLLCPIAIRNQYVDIKNCFFEAVGDSINLWFKLFCAPDAWTSVDTFFIDGDAYEPTFKRLRQQATIEPVQRGYEITIATANAATFYLTEELSKTYRPITVRDYLRPERANYLSARGLTEPASPFTERVGLISKVQPQGPMVGTRGSDLYIAGGFSFEFREGIVR